jgi:peptidoglycan/xylan/chitin deacetylase (PgdA/CDA1 family)
VNGTFTISLDFELHWGGFEKWPLEDYKQYFLNTRTTIPEMLSLFAQHEVHVTWATVGMLFHNSREELLNNAPSQKPSYSVGELSAYNYINTKGIGSNEEEDPFHFASSLIKKIVAVPFQELGTHTFSHYYCNEKGQTLEQFRDDMAAAKRAAAQYGTSLRSLVFPRNQFNEHYLKVCFEEGIRVVRSNPLDWFWNIESTQGESMWKRLNRGMDAYFPIGKKNTYTLDSVPVHDGFPLSLPASRLLRPYNPKELFLNTFKINRICNEMERAAKRGEVYHLWWHPHNFGSFPAQSLDGLRKILKHYAYCRDRWQMNSRTMGELADLRLHGK